LLIALGVTGVTAGALMLTRINRTIRRHDLPVPRST